LSFFQLRKFFHLSLTQSPFNAMSYNQNRVAQAITRAQDLQTLSAEEARILNQAFTVIWNRIRTQHNYAMNDLEFKVFNYFQSRWEGNILAQQAVARHWATRNNVDGLV
jgi:hypothetical protein